MNASGLRYGTAATAAARAPMASRAFAPMANGSWSIGSCFAVPTTDHKHEPSRRPTVIPT